MKAKIINQGSNGFMVEFQFDEFNKATYGTFYTSKEAKAFAEKYTKNITYKEGTLSDE